MKNLILILWFVLFLSSSALAGVEYVTEEVCHAMAGCVLNTKTGECPDCVIEKREIVHTHEETPMIKEKPVVKIAPNNKSTKKKKWRCIVKPCDWIDKNGNLKS
jgi:hypothetical protein